jgi:hypothetical protein
MRFDAQQPIDDQPIDDNAAHADLPPRLLALAERLSDEAALLARRYPAPSARNGLDRFEQALDGAAAYGDKVFATVAAKQSACLSAAAPLKRPRRAIAEWWMASAACVAIVLVVIAWRGGGPGEMIVQRGAASPSSSSEAGSQKAADQNTTGVQSVRTRADVNPLDAGKNLLEGLSGAEQEAVLDLLEIRSQQQGGLSI